MRGLAIILVLLTHSWYLWPSNLFDGGDEGVNLFFVLSGFLITSLLVEEHQRSGRISLLAFYNRRARRLFPTLWVMLAASLVTWALIGGTATSTSPGDEFAGLGEIIGYFYNWRFVFTPTLGAWGVAQTWSLGVEEQFYLFWPLLLIALLRWRPRWVGLVAISLGTLSFVSGAVVWTFAHNRDYVYYPTTSRLVGLMFGAFVAWALHRGLVRVGTKKTTVAAAIALLFLAWMLRYSAPTDGWIYLWGGGALAIAGSALVLGCLERNPLTRALSWSPLRYVGRISYSLYLWHFLVISVVVVLAPKLPAGEKVGLAFCIAIALAALSRRFIELPFLRRRRSSDSGGELSATSATGASV